GWQIPWLLRDGFHLPGGAFLALPALAVSLMGVVAFLVKVVALCMFLGMVRWTLPRFRYDQLMRLGWKGLVPLGLFNVLVTAFVVVATGRVQCCRRSCIFFSVRWRSSRRSASSSSAIRFIRCSP